MNNGDKDQEKSLSQSEDKFRRLFNGTADALFLHDLAGRFVEVNQSACDSLGYTREELLRLPFSAIVKDGDPEALGGLWARVMQGEKLVVQGFHQRRDGAAFPVEVHLSPFEYEGRPHILASARDIATRREAEKELAESDHRFSTFMDHLPAAVFIKDQAGRLEFANRYLREVFGWEDCLGKTTEELLPREMAEQMIADDQRALTTGPVVIQEKITDAQGVEHFFDTYKFPIMSEGSLALLGGIAVDVTAAKRALEALELSEQKYRNFYESLLEGFARVDMDGNIVETNQAYLEMLGYTAEEILGLRYQDVTPPKWHQFEADIVEQQVLARGYSDTYEKEYIRKDGTVFPIELRTYLIKDKTGAPSGMWAFLRDITARKQVEEALQKEKRFTEAILDSLPGTFFLLDSQGKQLRTNRSGLEISGYSWEELLNINALEAIAEEDRSAGQRALAEVLEKGEASLEARMLTKDGRKIPFLFTAKKFMIDDLPHILGTGMDIMKLKQVEEALRESEERYRGLFHNNHAVMFLIDPENVAIMDANPAACDFYGFSQEELLTKTTADLNTLPPDQVFQAMQRAKAEKQKYFQFQHRLAVGEVRDVEVFSGPIRIKGKDLLYSIVHDIGARKEAERALQESEARFRQVVESSPLPIGLANIDGKIGYLNPKFLETFGYSLEDVPRLVDWYELAYPDPTYRQWAVSRWQEGLEKTTLGSSTTEAIEVEVTCKDGSKRIMEIFGAPMGNQILAVFHDLTERKRGEEALRESEKKYRSLYQEFRGILDAIPDGVSLISPDMKIVWTNDTPGISFMDKRPSETIGEFCYQARHGRSARCEKCIVYDCFVSGKPTSGESVTPEERIFEIHAVPLYGDEGGVKAVIEVARDITARKRAEEEQAKLKEQMQEVQKLESLGVLAGGIAHDFNNLLMAILGNADLALLALSPASPARPNVEEITRASMRAADLCRQMLAYSGKGRFVVERYDLSEIVREMAQILEVSVSKKASLRYSFAADLPAVEIDATQMRQVIMNLITNASEALGDKSGLIFVSTGVMDCDRGYLAESYLDDKLPEGKYVYLEVTDTGVGMDEETRRRIFDPFFTTKFTGRGLGLAAVLGIVRGHHGAIKVYSEVGRGTTFKVLLPAKQWAPGEQGSREAQTVQPLPGGGTILLVDDDPEVRDVGTQMLERLGFQILTAAHGPEGLKVFQECGDKIDCVILDLTMPEMGGEEVLRELRRLRPDVRVILSSGYNEQEVTQRFAGKGLAGFIQKPYRLANLHEILNQVFG